MQKITNTGISQNFSLPPDKGVPTPDKDLAAMHRKHESFFDTVKKGGAAGLRQTVRWLKQSESPFLLVGGIGLLCTTTGPLGLAFMGALSVGMLIPTVKALTGHKVHPLTQVIGLTAAIFIPGTNIFATLAASSKGLGIIAPFATKFLAIAPSILRGFYYKEDLVKMGHWLKEHFSENKPEDGKTPVEFLQSLVKNSDLSMDDLRSADVLDEIKGLLGEAFPEQTYSAEQIQTFIAAVTTVKRASKSLSERVVARPTITSLDNDKRQATIDDKGQSLTVSFKSLPISSSQNRLPNQPLLCVPMIVAK
ncbi:MAG: hypothetical protein A2Y14_00590 [Verrucomicrobia bacterium GWF2_51_19]|nr:MAG: hypothetical protein A2Y14_00590 [Verrucomicrobia bacterium GWF2_51_19]HCJ11630.1 hypothetical protein [Opitutae bacterium]